MATHFAATDKKYKYVTEVQWNVCSQRAIASFCLDSIAWEILLSASHQSRARTKWYASCVMLSGSMQFFSGTPIYIVHIENIFQVYFSIKLVDHLGISQVVYMLKKCGYSWSRMTQR